MDELTLEKETTKLEKYLIKQGRRDFVDEMRAASAETLDAKLLSLAKHNQEILNTMAKDSDLQEAKKLEKRLKSVYTDQTKMNGKLARFCALIMKENE